MERIVALAGNPNWTGKTVSTARGRCGDYTLVDLPGTYSLQPHSAEETVARDFLLHGGAEAVIVVCDAGCLERNLNLALQCRELCKRVLVCVNLLDEAQRRGILVDCGALSRELGVPVIGIVARERGCRERVLAALDALMAAPEQPPPALPYPPEIRAAMERLLPIAGGERFPAPWLCLQLLAGETLPVSQELQEAAEKERHHGSDEHTGQKRRIHDTDIELAEDVEDILTIALRQDKSNARTVTIIGEVMVPGPYEYAENETIEDLIIQAGGLTDAASTARVDVSRRIIDPKAMTYSKEIAKTFSFTLKDGLLIDGDRSFTLMPYDEVMVRRSPGFMPQRLTFRFGGVFSAYTRVSAKSRTCWRAMIFRPSASRFTTICAFWRPTGSISAERAAQP